MTEYAFLKGHGTRNDFVLLPDPDGSIHGELSADRVVALCDRRGGIGGDGVMRVIRADVHPEGQAYAHEADWFMDYRNSDGSVSEMCGNGIRLFAHYLLHAGLVTGTEIAVATRDGIKRISVEGTQYAVDMGEPVIGDVSDVNVGGRHWPAREVHLGNPHAVAFVDDLGEAGSLLREPEYDRGVYPQGVNIEFVTRHGADHVAMRVHERGSGETESCGTGACAVMVAAADGVRPDVATTYRVDVPGGSVRVTWTPENRVILTGPAVLVAEGTTSL